MNIYTEINISVSQILKNFSGKNFIRNITEIYVFVMRYDYYIIISR